MSLFAGSCSLAAAAAAYDDDDDDDDDERREYPVCSSKEIKNERREKFSFVYLHFSFLFN